MTNAEKYLKNGVENIESLIQDYFHFIGCIEDSNKYNTIYQFFLDEAKPPLTEDERVILRNVKNYPIIARNNFGNVRATDEYDNFACMCAFSHLFQFIKNGEKYSIKELLENDK